MNRLVHGLSKSLNRVCTQTLSRSTRSASTLSSRFLTRRNNILPMNSVPFITTTYTRAFSTTTANASAESVETTTLPPPEYIEYTDTMDIIALLKERGFINATTADLAKHFYSTTDTTPESLSSAIANSASGKPVDIYGSNEPSISTPKYKRVIYAGFDPTGDTLHMGNLLVILALMHLHRAGHTIIPLVGGATGLVGDPSGRSSERTLLSEADVNRNVQGIRACLEKFLPSDREIVLPEQPAPQDNTTSTSSTTTTYNKDITSPHMVNNNDWYSKMSVVEYLRDVGKYFKVSTMMSKESVKRRIQATEEGNNEAGLSFTEFSYQTLQGFDFYLLNKNYNCTVQIGGSDQWGNITAGIEYTHRATTTSDSNTSTSTTTNSSQCHGFTLPLLTTSSGVKFGKSMGNAMWLSSEKTSAYQMYQYMLSTSDEDVCKFLKLFTRLSSEYINTVYSIHQQQPEKRLAQTLLAREVVEMIHGSTGVKQAEVATKLLFSKDNANMTVQEDGLLHGLTYDQVVSSLLGVAKTNIVKSVEREYDLLDVLIACKVCKTKSEGRRLIQGGGLYFNNTRVLLQEGPKQLIKEDQFLFHKLAVIRSGQKKHFIVELTE